MKLDTKAIRATMAARVSCSALFVERGRRRHPRRRGAPDADMLASARDVGALCDRVEALEAALRESAAWMVRNPSTRFGKDARDENVERQRVINAAQRLLEGE